MLGNIWIFIITFYGLSFVQCQDRIAPGVPPHHYQQVPHQNVHQIHQHQIQQQTQQQTQHHVVQHQLPQQVPQMQQIPQIQEIPNTQHISIQQNSHNHEHHHGTPQQILNAANIAQEKAHIAEHLDVPIDTSKMSEQELQFHYFKMHDSDNNNKLDGCELIKSLIHWHEEGNKDPNVNVDEKIFKDDELKTLIDPILDMDDANKDGFIDYPEFIQAQQKATPSTNQQ